MRHYFFTFSGSYVPPGLSFVVFSNPRSTSWATINPSLRDCRLSFSRIPGVPPGLQSTRPSGTVVCRFPASQEYLLGYNQPVPPGLSFVVFSNPRSTSWATINPSLRDCHLAFFRIPGVPPGLQSTRPSGTVVCRFPASQEYLLGYNQPVPSGLSFVVFPHPRSTSWATINPSLRDCHLSFSRIPGVPPGLQSTRPSGTVVCRFPASQEYLQGYNQPVPPGLSFVVFPHPRSTS